MSEIISNLFYFHNIWCLYNFRYTLDFNVNYYNRRNNKYVK